MKNKLKIIALIILTLFVSLSYGQSKTKITMTVEKDSIKLEELSKLIEDVQKLEKKWKLDVKIEFTEEQEKPFQFYFKSEGRSTYIDDSVLLLAEPNIKPQTK